MKICTKFRLGKEDTKSREENKAKAAAKIAAREGVQLERLEKIHKKAGVGDSLKIREGHRIKIDKPAQAQPDKPKTVPDFVLRLTDVNPPNRSDVSDEDLPDSNTLLKKIEKGNSSTDHYWDSDIDEIAQAVPSEILGMSFDEASISDKKKVKIDKAFTSTDCKRHLEDETEANSLVYTSPRKKSKKSEEDCSPYGKPNRDRLFLSSCTNLGQSSSPRPFVKNNLLDPVNTGLNGSDEFDPFGFDSTLFDITPSIVDDSKIESEEKLFKVPSENPSKQAEGKREPPKPQTNEDNEAEQLDPEWDEYEEWLKTCIVTE